MQRSLQIKLENISKTSSLVTGGVELYTFGGIKVYT